MKALRLVSFLIFAICAFCLSAEAQEKFTYKGDNGATNFDREEVTIVITQRPNGYEVSGNYTRGRSSCKLRGSYLPAGRRLRATCISDDNSEVNVTGSKQAEKDAFQVSVGSGGEFVAWRNGVKPSGGTDSSSSTSKNFNLAGTWICKQKCPAGGEGKTASIEQNGRNLTFTNEGGGTSKGNFESSTSVVATQWGNLTAMITDGGKKLNWANGTIWVKQ